MSSYNFKTAISGSFKFKPEIDQLHEEFNDHGVIVLEPSRGWLWTPNQRFASGKTRPLPAERGMAAEAIENRFLRAIDSADFLYLNNLEGYLGSMAAFEIGYTLGLNKPIYAREPFDAFELASGDIGRKQLLEEIIVTQSIADIVHIEHERQDF